jgi:microsomal dipeptidase-like Zn-dependent dipeptidase
VSDKLTKQARDLYQKALKEKEDTIKANKISVVKSIGMIVARLSDRILKLADQGRASASIRITNEMYMYYQTEMLDALHEAGMKGMYIDFRYNGSEGYTIEVRWGYGDLGPKRK